MTAVTDPWRDEPAPEPAESPIDTALYALFEDQLSEGQAYPQVAAEIRAWLDNHDENDL